MLTAILQVAGGLILLALGGEGSVRGGSSVAARFRVPPFIIGATVIAFGTSAPELVVTITAALKDSPGLALGNILGSNIANLGLILGLAALLRPVSLTQAEIKHEAPFIFVVMILMAVFGLNGTVGRLEGIILLSAMALFLFLTLSGMRRQPDPSEAPSSPNYSLPVELTLLVVGIAALIFGGQILVEGAVYISRTFGVSEYVIGAVAVAVGTSLPEVAASVTAAWHGKGDLAIGNVFGSNAFNVLFVLGTGASIRQISVAENIRPDLLVYIILTLFPLLILLWKHRLARWCGASLLACYAAYIIMRVT